MGKRIAIVEDEAAIRDNYTAAFEREGYSVDGYAAREPALEAFASRLPDLVVIDVNLENDIEGGFELCRQLRTLSADLPIIFLYGIIKLGQLLTNRGLNLFPAGPLKRDT